MIYASYDHNMPTFKVFLSFSFCFIFLRLQKLYIHCYLWEKLFFVHLHSYTRQTFSVYTRIKKSFSLYQHGLYTNSIPVQRFLFSFFNIHSWFYTKISLYTLIAHTQEFLFTHYLHTQNPSIHTFLLHIKKLFSLLYIYRHDICSQHFFLFSLFLVLSWFLFILFLYPLLTC